MNYKRILVYILSLLLASPQLVYGQAASSGAKAATTGASTVQVNRPSQETPTQQAAANGGNGSSSVNNAANQAKGKNNIAAVVSGVVAAGMFFASYKFGVEAFECYKASTGTLGATASACAFPTAMSVITAGMGALAVVQGAKNKNSAAGAGDAASRTASGVGFEGNKAADDPLSDPLVKSMIDTNKAKEGMDAAKKLGIDGKNPFKIGNKEYKPTDFASRDSMLAAGLPKDAVDKALAIAAKAEKEALKRLGAQTAVAGLDDSGGAGRAGNLAPTNSLGVGADTSGSGVGRLVRDPAGISVAGLTKNFNGDPIGVAADSIFSMMTRRYKLKEKQNSFIDGAAVNLQK